MVIAVAPAVSDIAHTIALSVAPVFLLAGIGSIMNVIAGRLNRVVDRSRLLESLHGGSSGEEHERHVWELRLLDRRISLASNAIFLCVASAVAVCAVVTLLFIAELAKLKYGNSVSLLFILAMVLLAAGLILFLIETRVAVQGIRVREHLLERERRKRFRL
jgi:ABC-type antimicrobial peptide transport system permease subunit